MYAYYYKRLGSYRLYSESNISKLLKVNTFLDFQYDNCISLVPVHTM